MASLSWNPSYSVNVSRFDDDHKHLLSIIDTLYEAISNRKSAAVVQPILDDLTDYTTHHFADEELMMDKTNYPALNSHREEHLDFLKEMRLIQQDIIAGKGGRSLTMVVVLHDWLTGHVIQTDKQYSEHLNAQGVF